jgi:hypothetical protein
LILGSFEGAEDDYEARTARKNIVDPINVKVGIIFLKS